MSAVEESPPERLVTVGRVVGPWGIRGQMRVEVLTANEGRFQPGGRLYIGGLAHTIAESHRRGRQIVLQLQNVETRTAAEGLRGALLEVPLSDVPPLPDGAYYYFQIIGLAVYTEENEYLGAVSSVVATGSNDVYVVRHDERELLIPAIEEVIRSVDVAGGRLVVRLLPEL